MKTRIAIIAAFVGAFALGQAGGSLAAPINTSRSNIKHPSRAVLPASGGPATATTFTFYKIDSAHTSQACMANMGTVVTKNGQQACKVSPSAVSHAGGYVGLGIKF